MSKKLSKIVHSPSVLLVIVNYNGKELLSKHLPSVLKTRYARLDFAVVDNDSTDGSLDFLRTHFPQVKLIELDSNYGFGTAFNMVCAKYDGYDYYVPLNNDVDVESDWLSKLVATAASDERVGAVGPRILFAKLREGKRIINSAGMVLDRYLNGYDRYLGQVDSTRYHVVEDVAALSGCAMLLRKKALRQVGGFDEDMFMYYEDVDLCLRMKEKGWRLVYDGRAGVFHDHMATSAVWGSLRRNSFMNRNRILSIKKRRGLLVAIWEQVRYPIDWLLWKTQNAATGISLKDYNLRRSGKESKF